MNYFSFLLLRSAFIIDNSRLVCPATDVFSSARLIKYGITSLTGPKGKDGTNGVNGISGTNGLNGMVPIIEFSMDADANLIYEVVGYEEGPTIGERFTVQEW